jgi:hypothetical protein
MIFMQWKTATVVWLQIQRSGIDSTGYQIFWEVVGLEWVPLSLVSTIQELLTNSVALDRERTVPTELPPLVGEVSANFCG